MTTACPWCKFDLPLGASVCQRCGAVKQGRGMFFKFLALVGYVLCGPVFLLFLVTHAQWARGEALPELLFAGAATILGPKILKMVFRLFSGWEWRRYSRD